MNDLSYWAATSSRQKSYADTPLPDSVDVAIIGGGYTGLSAALHLAQAGAKAAVLEHEHLGWGASSRNGGMVLPGYKAGLDTLIKRYGMERTRRLHDFTLEAIALVKSLIADHQIECELEETGYIYAAYKPAHYGWLADHQRDLEHAFNHPTRVIPRERQREELGSDYFHGLLVDDSAAGLHPAKYVNGLAQAADRAGASLHENAPVTRVKRAGDRFEVTTARGQLSAKDVIVATNGYTGGVIPWLQRRVVPVGSYIIVTEPLDAEIAHRLIPHRRMVFDTKSMLYYWRVLQDNRVMFGGRASFVPTSQQRYAEILRRGMVDIYPELANTKVEYAWGGKLGFTVDLMPHTGRHDGVFYSVGYGGHGVAFATYMGKRLAERVAGKDSSLPLEDLAFWPVPLYQGFPWFLPFAGWYYELKDRMS